MADPRDPLQGGPPPNQNPWDPFWVDRTAGLWYRPNEQSYFQRSDTMLNRPFIDPKWSGPDISTRPVIDQRGMTLPELDLQARFQRARNLGPWDPEWEAKFPFDPTAPPTPLEKDIGVNDIEPAARAIAARHAGEVLSMHAPEPPKKVVKKKEVK
jgi:hypothetical protein